MTCPNCGANNIDGSSFCIKCGNNLKETQQTAPVNQEIMQNKQATPKVVQNEQITQINTVQNKQTINIKPEKPVYNQTQNNITESVIKNSQNTKNTNGQLNYVMYIIAILLKPFKAFKEEESKLCDTKTALIFSSIIAVGMMIINLIISMISAIFVKTLDYSTFKYKTEIDFSRLKDLDWLNLIGKNLLIYAGIIVAITGIYYIASLIFKKSANFIKILSISVTSLIPYVVLGMLISPLIGNIWEPLAVFSIIIGAIYSILIFINLINENLIFDNIDMKIYFHLICLSVLASTGYFILIKIIANGITNDLSNLIN